MLTEADDLVCAQSVLMSTICCIPRDLHPTTGHVNIRRLTHCAYEYALKIGPPELKPQPLFTLEAHSKRALLVLLTCLIPEKYFTSRADNCVHRTLAGASRFFSQYTDLTSHGDLQLISCEFPLAFKPALIAAPWLKYRVKPQEPVVKSPTVLAAVPAIRPTPLTPTKNNANTSKVRSVDNAGGPPDADDREVPKAERKKRRRESDAPEEHDHGKWALATTWPY